MIRHTIPPRPDWLEKAALNGCNAQAFADGHMDWQEGVCYEFREEQIAKIVEASNDLHQRFLDAVDLMVTQRLYGQLGIPPAWEEVIEASWQRQEAAILGRFDFIYDGSYPPKLMEYNPDTPSALLEASRLQATWKAETRPNARQWNQIHSALVERFGWLGQHIQPEHHSCFLLPAGHPEVEETVHYLTRCAQEAGVPFHKLYLESLGWDHEARQFININDPAQRPIDFLMKHYPWEWILEESFAPCFLESPQTPAVQVFEPAWKLLLANKAMLVLLWKLFPEHPNLLPTYFEPGPLGNSYVEKPFYARQSHNIRLQTPQGEFRNPGAYDRQPVIYQAYAPPPDMDGYYPIVHSWIIGNDAVGIGILEDTAQITSHQTSRFIPHFY